MSSFLKQSFYNTCFIIKYNNRFVNNRICNAQTRKVIYLPYLFDIVLQKAHKQYVFIRKSVTLFRLVVWFIKHN